MVVVTSKKIQTTATVTSVEKIRNENRYGCLLENMILLFCIGNLVFYARPEIIDFAGIIPRKNPGVRIQNKVIALGPWVSTQRGKKAVVLHPHGGLQHNVKYISDNVASNKFVKQIYSSLSFS
jgi:hypothetical protein